LKGVVKKGGTKEKKRGLKEKKRGLKEKKRGLKEKKRGVKEKKRGVKEKKRAAKKTQGDQAACFPDLTWEPIYCQWNKKRVIAWEGPRVKGKQDLPDGWISANGSFGDKLITLYNNVSITGSNVGNPSGPKAPRKPT
jgi:hypothetical protein